MKILKHEHYEKLNYSIYQKRLQAILKDEKLQALGLEYKILAKTEYNYNIDCISLGVGKKELFIVGGTHGSEMIGIDFCLQLLESFKNIHVFDPNQLKITIIPLQNPEGFDISSNTLKEIQPEQFQEKSYEYYLRYRYDSLNYFALTSLNEFIENETKKRLLSPNLFLTNLKIFLKTNPNWQNLTNQRNIPNIQILYTLLDKIEHVEDYIDLKLQLLSCCKQTLDLLKQNKIVDEALQILIHSLIQGITKQTPWNHLIHTNQRLYQQMFQTATLDGLSSQTLVTDTQKVYQQDSIPRGSQIGHDATGSYINLNANTPLNPGNLAIKNKQTIYGSFVKSNIQNYSTGPLGLPTRNVDQFQHEIENRVLEKLIKASFESGNYLATLLYHGTGGQIFYQPFADLMSEEQYLKYYTYNEQLAEIYRQQTNYQLLNSSGSTGYGDYLRRTYPGVLLIELSKMGGNPIGPYGDINNHHRVIEENIRAIESLLNYFQNELKTYPKKERKK